MTKTLLVVLAHPDDEIGCAGTIAAHTGLGHRVVLAFLTRGEMTEALGPLSPEETAAERERHAREAGAMLGCEIRFLDFRDTRIEAGASANHAVARLVADVKPSAVLTWGDAWIRGMRHPDHQATGQIVRNAVTLARIKRVVTPLDPHREDAPVFALRDRNSALPAAAIDVSDQLDVVMQLGAFYRARVGWPPLGWHRDRLAAVGAAYGVSAAEEFDALESAPGIFATLFDSAVFPPL